MHGSSHSMLATEVQKAGDLYQQAAQALLLAYQRNKEATRHHAHGAFRAALHHARMSVHHVQDAQTHLEQALALSISLSAHDAVALQPLPMPVEVRKQ